MNSVVKTVNLGKEYPLPDGVLRVFQGIDFEIQEGDLVAIMGISGVGKTTLLNLLGGLDRSSEGQILFDGEDLRTLIEEWATGLRRMSSLRTLSAVVPPVRRLS